MNNCFILHHLGLGDHIICNGLVREVLKKCDILYFPVKHHNLKTVEKMFSDIPNKIIFLPVENDAEMIQSFYPIRFNIREIVKLGIFYETNFIKKGENFCESFYRNADIPYEKRWDSFKYQRDIEGERLISKTKIQDDYIFVHDDVSRNLNIDKSFLPNIKTYRPSHGLAEKANTTIFDYVPILENSKEIHCMDSSFAAMIDHIPSLKSKKKYIHRYVRAGSFNPKYENNWRIIE